MPMLVMYGVFHVPFSPGTRPKFTVPSASFGVGSAGPACRPRPRPPCAAGAPPSCAATDWPDCAIQTVPRNTNTAAALMSAVRMLFLKGGTSEKGRTGRPALTYRADQTVRRSTSAYGVVPWLDAAKSRCPVAASVTERALPVGLPSLAMLPSTVTVSPIFMVFRVHPWRIRPFGLPISIAQLVTLP